MSNTDQHYQIVKNYQYERQNYLKVHEILTSEGLVENLFPEDVDYEILNYLCENFPTSHSVIPPTKCPINIPYPRI